MNRYIYVFVNKGLDVWKSKEEAIKHYFTIYNFYPRDQFNPKYAHIINEIKKGKEIIDVEDGKYNFIVDHTSIKKPRDIGIMINLFEEYDKETTLSLWIDRFEKIKSIAHEFNVSFKNLIPLENFTEADFEKFYTKIFNSFDISIDSIRVTATNDYFDTYKAIINDNSEMDFCKGISYGILSDQIDLVSKEFKKQKTDIDLEISIKDWYINEYPNDEAGKTLSSSATFLDLNNLLNAYKGNLVYDLLGGESDTVIRERCFMKLAELTNQDYREIYNKWMTDEIDMEEEIGK